MEKNQTNTQKFDDEIDIRDIFIALWKQKILIICSTFVAALITGIVSVFVLTPVYQSKLNIVMNMPDTYHTKYGDYTLPITSNQQYIDLITSNDILVKTIKDMGYDAKKTTVEDLRKRISIISIPSTNGTEQNSFNVNVAADNSNEALKLANTLYDNYTEFLDDITAEGAYNYYYNLYSLSLKSLEVSLKSTQEILKKNEELLAQTPETIDQEAALQAIKDQSDTSDYIILDNVINPNYTKIEADIVANKQSINDIENSMRVYNEYLQELDVVKAGIDEYHETGDIKQLEANIVSITQTNVYLPSDPIAPSRKTSPSNLKNVIIGAFLGSMIGVLITYIKHYWFTTK